MAYLAANRLREEGVAAGALIYIHLLACGVLDLLCTGVHAHKDADIKVYAQRQHLQAAALCEVLRKAQQK